MTRLSCLGLDGDVKCSHRRDVWPMPVGSGRMWPRRDFVELVVNRAMRRAQNTVLQKDVVHSPNAVKRLPILFLIRLE